MIKCIVVANSYFEDPEKYEHEKLYGFELHEFSTKPELDAFEKGIINGAEMFGGNATVITLENVFNVPKIHEKKILKLLK